METEPGNIKQLLSDLKGFNKEKRRIAAIKLGLNGSETAIRVLILAVGDKCEDMIVREKAALMLGKLRVALAIDNLVDALNAPGYVPLYAAEALGKIGVLNQKIQLSLLYLVSNQTASDKAKKAAQEALIALGYKAEANQEELSLFDCLAQNT